MTKERPILFSAPMVRAILEGRKIQTRRILKQQHHPDLIAEGYRTDINAEIVQIEMRKLCPYGQPGDRLWVRETHYVESTGNADGSGKFILYRATDEGAPVTRWKPSIHMPRWASRITLEIVSVRVERLQDISEADCIAEGMNGNYIMCDGTLGNKHASAKQQYTTLWESINGHGSWDANPWVWVIEFKKTISPHDVKNFPLKTHLDDKPFSSKL